MRRYTVFMIVCATVALLCVAGCLIVGAADIPVSQVLDSLSGGGENNSWNYIVNETRLPAALTAALAGAALSLAGLLMQTTFNNPLAGPSILGISTGSSLGVALVMLGAGALGGVGGRLAILGGALGGAAAVMLLLLAMSSLVRSTTMLLIVGILLGYLASSAISLLNFFATQESVHSFVIWGLGTFGGVTRQELPLFAALVIVPSIAAMVYAKPLNALLLGDRYAESAGVNIRSVRAGVLFLSGALTAFVTAWCGPVGFLGLVVPHIARLGVRSSSHVLLIPATAVAGAAIGALCQLLCVAPGALGIIPLNAVTPVIGVPIIIYIIVKRRSIFYFN